MQSEKTPKKRSQTTLRIASRKSPLALWQAEFVKQQLKSLYPKLEVNIIGIQTEGDKNLDSSLTKIGGKGLFVKALEDALLEGRADIAVHSLKDVPAELPDGLELTTILKREDPRDVLVTLHHPSVSKLPPKAIIGTSSLRRQSQLFALRPDLQTKMLRGNVDTRIQKLMRGEYDGMILALAGLKRLNLLQYVQEIFNPEIFLPAVGQGALCIECRSQDKIIQDLLQPLHHEPTALCVLAERTLNNRLGGSCQLPIAAFAELTPSIPSERNPRSNFIQNIRSNPSNRLKLQALVGNLDGKKILKASMTSASSITKPKGAIELGNLVANLLIDAGAKAIIDEVQAKHP